MGDLRSDSVERTSEPDAEEQSARLLLVPAGPALEPPRSRPTVATTTRRVQSERRSVRRAAARGESDWCGTIADDDSGASGPAESRSSRSASRGRRSELRSESLRDCLFVFVRALLLGLCSALRSPLCNATAAAESAERRRSGGGRCYVTVRWAVRRDGKAQRRAEQKPASSGNPSRGAPSASRVQTDRAAWEAELDRFASARRARLIRIVRQRCDARCELCTAESKWRPMGHSEAALVTAALTRIACPQLPGRECFFLKPAPASSETNVTRVALARALGVSQSQSQIESLSEAICTSRPSWTTLGIVGVAALAAGAMLTTGQRTAQAIAAAEDREQPSSKPEKPALAARSQRTDTAAEATTRGWVGSLGSITGAFALKSNMEPVACFVGERDEQGRPHGFGCEVDASGKMIEDRCGRWRHGSLFQQYMIPLSLMPADLFTEERGQLLRSLLSLPAAPFQLCAHIAMLFVCFAMMQHAVWLDCMRMAAGTVVRWTISSWRTATEPRLSNAVSSAASAADNSITANYRRALCATPTASGSTVSCSAGVLMAPVC